MVGQAGFPNILLVEDNPAHAALVKKSLEDTLTAEIHHVTDGERALDYLFRRGQYADAQKSPRPDLVLLDIRLPRVDGLEVLKEIRGSRELKQIPVVILTTSSREQEVERAYDLCANSYVVKPLDFDKFRECMNDLGHYWLDWNYHL